MLTGGGEACTFEPGLILGKLWQLLAARVPPSTTDLGKCCLVSQSHSLLLARPWHLAIYRETPYLLVSPWCPPP